jgi:YD repeat-containing protein
VTDPSGRGLTLNYDSFNRVTSIVDPIGRTVQYTYNSQGTLATVIDPVGGVTKYAYDPQNNQHLTSVTDARGLVLAQNTYDSIGRVVQQVEADGDVFSFAYTLLNPLAPTSPVLKAAVTDSLGNQTTYRFDPGGLFTDVTDPAGQPKSFVRDPQHSDLVQAETCWRKPMLLGTRLALPTSRTSIRSPRLQIHSATSPSSRTTHMGTC